MMGKLRAVSNWSCHIPSGMEFETGQLLQDRSLAKSWVKVLCENPNRELFCEFEGDWISRGEFLSQTTKSAGAMVESGLTAGDRIILSSSSSLGMIIGYVAALRLGLVVVPVNPSYTKDEISHIVRDVKPSGAIVDSPQRAEWILDTMKSPGFVSSFTGPGSDLPLPKGDLAVFFTDGEINQNAASDLDLDQSHLDTPALIAYTSGTTGRPKGAVLTHGNLLASARSLNLAWRWDHTDRLVLSLPLFHMHGLGVGVNGTLCAGSSAVIMDKFEPGRVAQAVKNYSASMFFGVPTMYQRFLESEYLDSLASLRLMVSGSAPLSKEVHKEIEIRTGKIVLERYGTTESLINISNPYDSDRVAGKVGFPLPGVEVYVSDDKGEIFIGGPTVFAGYLNDPIATASAFPEKDRIFATGDVGEIDDDGRISIAGRLKDVIISGGYNVYPKEVEDVLRTHPAVKDAAVIGVESREWGEEVVGFIIMESAVSEIELILHSANTLAGYKRPKRIIFVQEFPRNALGKVISSDLRGMLTQFRVESTRP
ncbi:MAG: AMP-binding protein [Acidimicrobiaceae bacterium]|nr:AMP-binding protein [Acidimicrobiaceae bacterium]